MLRLKVLNSSKQISLCGLKAQGMLKGKVFWCHRSLGADKFEHITGPARVVRSTPSKNDQIKTCTYTHKTEVHTITCPLSIVHLFIRAPRPLNTIIIATRMKKALLSSVLTEALPLLLTFSLVSAQSDDTCTTCFGGSPPTNLDGSSLLGNTSCTFFDSLVAKATEGTVPCQSAQIAAYQGCGCPVYDEAAFCSMCHDDFWMEIGNTRNRPVPLKKGSTCSDWLFPRQDSGMCEDVERVAYHCTSIPYAVCASKRQSYSSISVLISLFAPVFTERHHQLNHHEPKQ